MSPDLVEAGSGRGGGGGVRQSIGEALTAGFGVRWPKAGEAWEVEAAGSREAARRGRWRRLRKKREVEAGGREEVRERIEEEERVVGRRKREEKRK
uniref:Uncharacterized protein n=1 Tax=Oryza rufipogon TaxID=4529 RepID=A0A0E0P9P2_ORYRU